MSARYGLLEAMGSLHAFMSDCVGQVLSMHGDLGRVLGQLAAELKHKVPLHALQQHVQGLRDSSLWQGTYACR